MPNKMEELGEKGAGKVKGAVAAVKGLTGVFNTLAQQHGEASALLKQAKAAGDSKKRIDLWLKIRTELLSHERAELKVVYPALREHKGLEQIAEEHQNEASELERRIMELDGIDPASGTWKAKLTALIDLVQHHVDEEENEWFPEAVDVIPDAESKELEGRFLAQKEAIVEQLR